jgi:hypothetical protein
MGFHGLTLVPRQRRGAKRGKSKKACGHRKWKRADRLSSWWRKQT